ncbi:glycosyltransferase family 4 protein [Actinomarinicola tropica]|uniref:Glycosyltransferase n=1 Tax=Actinomarinicola tropica TaxID=2789776 RepID=A0A5Q2RGP8_9ACTN|nr:glycosyltransferase family 4 protein [Actinomarinicola tropica]QGG95999.1 glycosyltransferase [Actinomarinicola tropica]
MKVLVSFPGLHRVHRGAEVALEAIGDGLARRDHDVVVHGSGPIRHDRAYRYRRTPVIDRERLSGLPSLPLLREPSSYESLGFNLAALARLRTGRFDATITGGFPWDNLFLRRPARGGRPPHVFVTENGDWPALLDEGDARLFSCDALVCTNPLYLERNRERWNCELIPNGVDVDRFSPGDPDRDRLGLPRDRPLVLIVSALIPSKRVEDGIRAVAALDDAALVVAGVGPLEAEVERLGAELLGPDRFQRRSFAHDDMPALYRSADLLLHLTHVESFGNVYVEAMATGLPVVAHRSVVTEWILPELDGLVDTDDRTALVAALDDHLRAGRDAGAAGRVAAARERFAWSVVAARYEELLERVVG